MSDDNKCIRCGKYSGGATLCAKCEKESLPKPKVFEGTYGLDLAPIPGTRAKHTPGPWGVRGRVVYGECTEQNRQHVERLVAECGQSTSREVDEANAHLIAAAPALLHALRALVIEMKAVDKTNPIALAAQSAIAKAEGRS